MLGDEKPRTFYRELAFMGTVYLAILATGSRTVVPNELVQTPCQVQLTQAEWPGNILAEHQLKMFS
eukprot:779384-Amphidinium_carterae.2